MPNEGLPVQDETKKANRKLYNRSLVLTIITAAVLALFMRAFVLEIIVVDGPSMEPTLYTGERVFVEKLSYVFGKPKRGDVVVCYFPGYELPLVKRIMGMPGDVMEIREGRVYVNGILLDDITDSHRNGLRPHDMPPKEVPPNHIFVMGDHRDNSLDSCDLGTVPFDYIHGKCLMVVWPLTKYQLL